MSKIACNLCSGEKFVDVGTRRAVGCADCGSLERTRLLWLYIQDNVHLTNNTKILHFAPELGLYNVIMPRVRQENYLCSDISSSRYKFAKHFKIIDMCHDLESIDSDSFDLIIHSHVLEHIPCNISYVLYHIHRILKPSGKHICVIPFISGNYEESFEELSPEEATRRFGQSDHVRRFGTKKIDMSIGKILRLPKTFDAARDFGEKVLRESNIPEAAWKGFHPSTVLCLAKEDYRL